VQNIQPQLNNLNLETATLATLQELNLDPFSTIIDTTALKQEKLSIENELKGTPVIDQAQIQLTETLLSLRQENETLIQELGSVALNNPHLNLIDTTIEPIRQKIVQVMGVYLSQVMEPLMGTDNDTDSEDNQVVE
jgi:hypothetical protein